MLGVFQNYITPKKYGKRESTGLLTEQKLYFPQYLYLRLAAWFYPEQVTYEEVHAPSAYIGNFTYAVASAWNNQQVEIFICFD